jgi:hypothetical protein
MMAAALLTQRQKELTYALQNTAKSYRLADGQDALTHASELKGNQI